MLMTIMIKITCKENKWHIQLHRPQSRNSEYLQIISLHATSEEQLGKFKEMARIPMFHDPIIKERGSEHKGVENSRITPKYRFLIRDRQFLVYYVRWTASLAN